MQVIQHPPIYLCIISMYQYIGVESENTGFNILSENTRFTPTVFSSDNKVKNANFWNIITHYILICGPLGRKHMSTSSAFYIKNNFSLCVVKDYIEFS